IRRRACARGTTSARSTAPRSTTTTKRSAARPKHHANAIRPPSPRAATPPSPPRSRPRRSFSTPRTTTSSISPRTPAGIAGSAAPASAARPGSALSDAQLGAHAGIALDRLGDDLRARHLIRGDAVLLAEHLLDHGEARLAEVAELVGRRRRHLLQPLVERLRVLVRQRAFLAAGARVERF